MLKTKMFIGAFCAALITLGGCKSEKIGGLNSPFLDSKDITTTMNLLTEVRDDVILKVQDPDLGNLGYPLKGAGKCPEVIFEKPKGTYPNTVTLDYGEDCVCHFNIMKSGKVVVKKEASLTEPGVKWEIHFEDYAINGVKIAGHQTLIPLEQDDASSHSFKMISDNTQLKWPNGKSVSFNAEGTVEMVAGMDNGDPEDDTYAFSGSISGISTSGAPFLAYTTEPLIKAHNCRWITEGKLQIGESSNSLVANFGRSKCDGDVVITKPDGKFREMDLVFEENR